MAAVDLRASKTGYLTLDQAAAINASDAIRRFVLPRDRERMRPHRGRVRPPRAQFPRGDLRRARRKGRARGEAPRLLRGLLRVIGWTYWTYCFCKYFDTYLQLTMAGSTSTRSAPRSRGASF